MMQPPPRWRVTPPARCLHHHPGGAPAAPTIRAAGAAARHAHLLHVRSHRSLFTYPDPAGPPRRTGSIGNVPGQQVVVVDEVGRECAADVVGEPCIAARSCRAATELRGALATSLPAPKRNGRVVGISRVTRMVSLWFVGRQDDQIKISGVRVSPRKSKRWRPRYRASLRGRASPTNSWDRHASVTAAASSPGLTDRIREHCRRQLPNYAAISAALFEPDLPLTATGKPDRAVLAARVQT
jgi:acyl-coenzyme A synthetase/AMP-(fatty) acid ligase